MRLNKRRWGFNFRAVFEDMVPKLSSRAEKLGRQVVMMRHAATVPLCRDTTPLRKKKQSGFEIIITKTRGACVITRFWLNQEVGRDQDGLGRLHMEEL